MFNRFESYVDHFALLAPLVLRLGIGFVFAYFGWSAISNPDMWTRLVPAWEAAIIPANTLVLFHGAFELVFGVLLIVGVRTRIVAGLLTLSIFHTLFLVSGPTFARDVAIFAATLSLFLAGPRHLPERPMVRV